MDGAKFLYGNNRDSYGVRGFGPSAPVETGKEYDIEIEDISKQGDGIARIEGFVIFIPETGVGDKAKIMVDKVLQRFAIAHKV
jgi:predicted RNA-binding protein with TRAM domain